MVITRERDDEPPITGTHVGDAEVVVVDGSSRRSTSTADVDHGEDEQQQQDGRVGQGRRSPVAIRTNATSVVKTIATQRRAGGAVHASEGRGTIPCAAIP